MTASRGIASKLAGKRILSLGIWHLREQSTAASGLTKWNTCQLKRSLNSCMLSPFLCSLSISFFAEIMAVFLMSLTWRSGEVEMRCCWLRCNSECFHGVSPKQRHRTEKIYLQWRICTTGNMATYEHGFSCILCKLPCPEHATTRWYLVTMPASYVAFSIAVWHRHH